MVVGVTLIRCLTFVVPAIIASLILGEIILYKIQKSLYLDGDGIQIITVTSFIEAILAGLMLPLISSLHPILENMKISLQESISLTRSKLKAIFIQVKNKD